MLVFWVSVVVIASLLVFIYLRNKHTIKLYHNGKTHSSILQQCTFLNEQYVPPFPWGAIGILQDMCSLFLKKHETLAHKIHILREKIQDPMTPQLIHLDWVVEKTNENGNWQDERDIFFNERDATLPTIIVFPGITGNIKAGYVRSLIEGFLSDGNSSSSKQRLRFVVFNRFGTLEDAPLNHHVMALSPPSETVSAIVNHVDAKLQGRAPLVLIGFSAGGQNVTRYLGCNNKMKQENVHIPKSVVGAFTSSSAYHQGDMVDSIRTHSKIYDWFICSAMLSVLKKNAAIYQEYEKSEHNVHGFSYEKTTATKSMLDFFEIGLARVMGYKDLEKDMYQPIGVSVDHVENISVPLFALHSADDGAILHHTLPYKKHSNPNFIFALTKHGGHCSFLRSKPSNPFGFDSLTLQDVAAVQFIKALLQKR